MIRYCIRGHVTNAHVAAKWTSCFACGSRAAELLPVDESLPRRLEEVAHERDADAREWESRQATDPTCADTYAQLARRARAQGHDLRAIAAEMRSRGAAREQRAGGSR